MKYLNLDNGLFTILDDIDYGKIRKYKWFPTRNGNTIYVKRNRLKGENKPSSIYLHREIMKANIGQEIDHINRNGLDNRRKNLRIVLKKEQRLNQKKRKDSHQKYTGVRIIRGKYITARFRDKHLGMFATEEDAKKAYDEAIEMG